MSIGPYAQSVQDEIMTSALVRAAGNLLDDLVDRVLRNEERVATAAEGKLLIAADDGMEESRTVSNASSRSRRRPYGCSPAAPLHPRAVGARRLDGGFADHDGARRRAGGAGAWVAARVPAGAGERCAADPALVKKLAVELYLAPKRKPDVATLDFLLPARTEVAAPRRLRPRHPQGSEKALDATEQLDLDGVLETRRAGATGTALPAAIPGGPSSPLGRIRGHHLHAGGSRGRLLEVTRVVSLADAARTRPGHA